MSWLIALIDLCSSVLLMSMILLVPAKGKKPVIFSGFKKNVFFSVMSYFAEDSVITAVSSSHPDQYLRVSLTFKLCNNYRVVLRIWRERCQVPLPRSHCVKIKTLVK